MSLSQPDDGTLTVSTTELSFISGTSTLQTNSTPGVYQLFADLSALASGDSFRIRIKEEVIPSGTQNIIEDVTIAGPLAQPVYVSAPLLLMNGWDMTIVKVKGTDRSIPYSIRQVS